MQPPFDWWSLLDRQIYISFLYIQVVWKNLPGNSYKITLSVLVLVGFLVQRNGAVDAFVQRNKRLCALYPFDFLYFIV